jgi:hypothetical protein
LLAFLQNPLFEINKVECMRILNLFSFEPFDEEREVIRYFFAIEDSVDHMAAE